VLNAVDSERLRVELLNCRKALNGLNGLNGAQRLNGWNHFVLVLASKKDIPYQSLIKVYLAQKIAEER
jgi:hypothetical protein